MTSNKFFHPDQLTAIRAGCDWQGLLDALGVRADVKRCTANEFWGYSPFNANENTASFHVKAPGLWYCWSTHATAPGRAKPGGGVIELVQAVHATRGEIMKLNEAAGWIVDLGLAPTDQAPPPPKPDTPEKQNLPITTDLTPKLTEQGTHAAFVLRGISQSTCQYLHCGYLNTKRGSLAGRLVFQVGGVNEGSRVILSHIGRATSPEQEAKGKWRFYRGFNPSLELYNLDNLLLDPEAAEQATATQSVLLVEGAFDVAKCVEAGLKNVVATFGTRLSDPQADKLSDLSSSRVLVLYDRDKAGQKGCTDAIVKLQELGIQASAFDWQQQFGKAQRLIPDAIQDPCDFSVEQLRWLRGQGML